MPLRIGGRLPADDAGELRARVAAILLLLYAQPLGRILRLTIDDIDITGPDVLLHTTTQRHHAAAGGTWNRYSPSRSAR